MSRKIIRNRILSCIRENNLEVDQRSKEIADLAINCTLRYLLDFSVDISHTLAEQELYSHSMATGLIINKMKEILNDD